MNSPAKPSAALLKVAACAAALALHAAAGAQVLRWSSQGDLQTLDPYSQNELLTNSINGQVYETLIGRDRQLNLVPALATEWQQVTPTLWRMKLRPEVKFHDGRAFSADDVVFSVERARDPASGIRVYASALGEVRKIDPLTVEFALPQVNPIFLEHAALVQMMSKSWCEQHDAVKPQDFKAKEIRHTTLNANGTGPFVVVSRLPDNKTVFKRNPNWWGKFDGNVQEVVYTPIKSDSTRTAALLSGELQLVLDPPPQDLDRLRASAGVKVADGVENRVIFIGMDQGRDELKYSSVKGSNPFKDVRVRKALYHAVDIETLRTSVMRGLARPTGVMSPSPLGNFNDAELEKRLPFDLPRARTLMTQAGYPNGFEVTLDCPNNRYINDEKICIALAGMWSQIGIKVNVNAQPRALYFAKAEKLDISMYMLGWGGTITDAEVMLTPVLRSRGANGVGYFNWGDYKNSKLDELAAASSVEPDRAKREQLIKAALREHNEQVHHIPLHRQVIPWAMRSNVEAVHRPDNWLEWRWVTVR
ncbi:peptide/nickel transport system substrate-binding protein [Variovorax sp. CF079]|uniref:ABC transporter substrate-binding protein n=1 Tax=Variovorax sp. CF079 TaxID=1882774 RepID=UPI000891AFDF|nr:ABC transporter substrate-binding protein [Variovorax sp. CF079]SDD77909.1 peptide/nickel transport system substrate-binding protein [Variovorax sp. CF079]